MKVTIKKLSDPGYNHRIEVKNLKDLTKLYEQIELEYHEIDKDYQQRRPVIPLDRRAWDKNRLVFGGIILTKELGEFVLIIKDKE